MPDLVSGYGFLSARGAQGGAGILTWHRGNVDLLWPNSPEAQKRKAEGTFTDAPFLSPARAFALPVAPDFLGAGDFDADGHWDVVAVTRGGEVLHWLPGDGKGGFGAAQAVKLPGKVTALTVGEINRRDGLDDVVVGVNGDKGPQVLVFEWPEGALRGEPEVFDAPSEVTALALGQLDDHYADDLAVLAGKELLVIHGRDRRLSLDATRRAEVKPATVDRHTLPFAVAALAVGDFVLENGNRPELALLADDGVVHILNPATAQEITQHPTGNSKSAVRNPQLVRANVSSLPTDDLVVVDPAGRQVHIVVPVEEQAGADETSPPSFALRPWSATLDVAGEPVAALPMRLNVDALSDLVILKGGPSGLTVGMTAAMATWTVDSAGAYGAAPPSFIGYPDTYCATFRCDWDPAQGQYVCVQIDSCTLQAALYLANRPSSGPDLITFNIGGGGPQTINATGFFPSGLGASYEPVTIDGTTQPGYAGTPLIEVTGASFYFRYGASVVFRGLAINGASYAINLLGPGGGSIIEGNFFGTDLTGTVIKSNGISIDISASSNNIVGGTTQSAGNLISGSGSGGVRIESLFGYPYAATGNLVQGNKIGTDVTGSAALSNNGGGVRVEDTLNSGLVFNNTIGGTQPGAGNLISGNWSSTGGVYLKWDTQGNLVQGNLIGTNAAGTARLGNYEGVLVYGSNQTIGGTTPAARNVVSGSGRDGVRVGGDGLLVQGNFIGTDVTGTDDIGNFDDGAECGGACTIGGALAAARNIISGNDDAGVELTGFSSYSHVEGNYIGTDVTGSAAVRNSYGVAIRRGGTGIIVGGPTAAPGTPPGNLISGNMVGVYLDGMTAQPSPAGNFVRGNLIGTDATGLLPLGNDWGVEVNRSNDNVIGGLLPGEGNAIAFNGTHRTFDGIVVWDGTGNSILGNAIYSNRNLGIDLSGDGVSPNDPGDGDAGANNRQNFPVITSVAGGIIKGTLNSLPNTTFRLEFFSNSTCDPSGHGEGETYLGFTEVTTDGDGNVTFEVSFSGAGTNVTATATNLSTNDTSEFSACFAGLVVNSIGDANDQTPGDGACNTGGTILRNGTPEAECTLRAAIEEANATDAEDTIRFDILGTGVPIIQPQNALPPVFRPLVIDGTTEPTSGKVRLDGSNAAVSTSGLSVWANTTVKGLDIVNFPQHGISISDGGLTFEGASNPGSQVSGNGGVGIRHSGAGGLTLAGTIAVNNNCLGGIWSDAFDPLLKGIRVGIAGDLQVNNNGQGTGCQGGGIHTRSGLFGPATVTLEVKNNNGDGIRTLAENDMIPSTGMYFLGIVKVFNNSEFGIHSSLGFVNFGGTAANLGQVSNNGKTGVLGKGVVFAYAEVLYNGGWGVDSTGDVTMWNVKVGGNTQGGVKATGVLRPGSRNVEMYSNQGDGIRILGVDHAIIPSFSAELTDALIYDNQGHGIFVSGTGSFFAGRLTSNENGADGVNVAGDADIRDSEICGNGGQDLVIGGSQNLQNVECGADCDQDEDGVEDIIEDGVDSEGDGNNDGIRDRRQANVTSLPNAVDGRYVTLASPNGTNFAQVQALADPAPGTPPPTPNGLGDFPLGFFAFKVQGLPAGGTTAVTLFLPAGTSVTTYWKYGPTPNNPTPHWYEFLFDGTTGAEILPDQIILHFMDGLRGDHDLTANGEIVEPGGPMQPLAIPTPTPTLTATPTPTATSTPTPTPTPTSAATPTPTVIRPVGGYVEPVNRWGLLAPWLGLAALLAVAVAAVVIRMRMV